MIVNNDIRDVQARLGLTADGDAGPLTWSAIHDRICGPALSPTPMPVSGTVLGGDGTWPFTVEVMGDDLVYACGLTCFGGDSDPQDNGETASGINTRNNSALAAVSLPMDIRGLSHISAEVHAALDGCPIPILPWHTLVEITSGGKTIRPSAGVIDRGPGKQATTKGHPVHACDLTIAAARQLDPHATARDFSVNAWIRIIGGARYVHLAPAAPSAA